MGVRATSYLRVGGFAALDHDEDVDLVTRLAASGAQIVWVVTSSRLAARAPRGVARDLALSLAADDQPA
jgi:hypothetical protein